VPYNASMKRSTKVRRPRAESPSSSRRRSHRVNRQMPPRRSKFGCRQHQPTEGHYISSVLGSRHPEVGTSPCQQFGVVALLDNLAGLHHQNVVGIADRRKTVRDNETRSVRRSADIAR
jgi:hypothetical protein